MGGEEAKLTAEMLAREVTVLGEDGAEGEAVVGGGLARDKSSLRRAET